MIELVTRPDVSQMSVQKREFEKFRIVQQKHSGLANTCDLKYEDAAAKLHYVNFFCGLEDFPTDYNILQELHAAVEASEKNREMNSTNNKVKHFALYPTNDQSSVYANAHIFQS